jgi:isopenicillin-N epimerase
VVEAAERMRRDLNAQPSNFYWRALQPLLESSRESLAAYLHTRPDELLLLPNVTYAINLVVSSLSLLRGTEILLTDHDYGAMSLTLQRWTELRDWNLRSMELPFHPGITPDELFSAIRNAITPATRVLFLYHVTSPTGIRLPLKEICAYAREHDILTIVDGAHAPGAIPVNLAEIGADFYAANLHKWLMCPVSGGFLHVSRHRRTDLRALITSWGWGYTRPEAFDPSPLGGQRWQADLEFHGTTDRIPQLVIPHALQLREQLGGDAAIQAHMQHLANHARKVIPLPCATAQHPDLASPLLVFDFPLPNGTDCNTLRDRLYHEHHIECPLTQAAGKTYLRVSTAIFNTESDIDSLASAVRKLH